MVYADRDRLMQVFINLLSNAAKFADPDARPRPGRRPRTYSGGYLVEVTDNGEGVEPQDQQIIFEKFAKARDRNTGRPSGSGLGLTISRHIVEHHGGRIWVDSPPGKGATFSVFLPGVGDARAARRRPRPTSRARSRRGGAACPRRHPRLRLRRLRHAVRRRLGGGRLPRRARAARPTG